MILLAALSLCACQRLAMERKASTPPLTEETAMALNRLRDDINSQYGFRDGVPRINLGPCGRFAKTFREEWNARFTPKIYIAFVMANDGSECFHVLVRLPDGRYYDGGNGVMPAERLFGIYPNSRIEEMREFDLELLDKRSYGLGRNYPVCPNYSDETTSRLIKKCLVELRPVSRTSMKKPE